MDTRKVILAFTVDKDGKNPRVELPEPLNVGTVLGIAEDIRQFAANTRLATKSSDPGVSA